MNPADLNALVERLRDLHENWGGGKGPEILLEAAQALTAADAEIARLTRERDECSPYLKDGETPAERIKRLHGEISGMMKTLAVYTDRALAAETALTETRAMLAEAIEALNYCEQYGSAAVKLLARSTLTKLQEAGHVAG